MPTKKPKQVTVSLINKAVDFGKQLFAGVLRSRTGALTELAKLSRFQKGTKTFERYYNKLLPLMEEIKNAYKEQVLVTLPAEGLRLGIIDDTSIKKAGKQFPKQQIHHEHTSNTFYSGMKCLTSLVYQKGKVAPIDSKLVDKQDNKLTVAQEVAEILFDDYFVDILLFDSWYCKSSVLEYVQARDKIFVSRIRTDSAVLGEKRNVPLKSKAEQLQHKEYDHVRIHGKSYWIYEMHLHFKTYGKLRVVISKEGVHNKPVFFVTNTEKFSAKFIVMLYLRRFAIEVFFKDAKQFLNFETFLCRNAQKWELHLQLINVLHWAMQKKKSISKTVRKIRENIEHCLLFINQNPLLRKFFEGMEKRCPT